MQFGATPTPDPNAPWPPDWSQFWPDIISGGIVALVVGVIVGAAFWRIERRAKKRESRVLALSRWEPWALRIGANGYRDFASHRQDPEGLSWELEHWLDFYKEIPAQDWEVDAPGYIGPGALVNLRTQALLLSRLAEETRHLIANEYRARGFKFSGGYILGTSPASRTIRALTGQTAKEAFLGHEDWLKVHKKVVKTDAVRQQVIALAHQVEAALDAVVRLEASTRIDH